MRGGGARVLSFGVFLIVAANVALAAPAGIAPAGPPTGPQPFEPIAKADTDRSCYLPGEDVTFFLRNVGTSGTLVYQRHPNFIVWNETLGNVRDARGGYPDDAVRIGPGENISWVWDGRWDRADGTRKGQLVPAGEYTVTILALIGVEIPELVELASKTFDVGPCLAQISAGEDSVILEGQNVTFVPTIKITGNATVTAITWDLDPAADTNGDGNPTNDIDLVGENPAFTWGDDGVYPVVMNMRGFGTIQAKTRVDQDVVFSIDSSGSMVTADPTNQRKLAAKAYVDLLVPHDRAAVVDFDTDAVIVGNVHLTEDYVRIKTNIDKVDADGGSYLTGGVRRGLRELQEYGDPSHTWLEIFMSDGSSTVLHDQFNLPKAIQFAKDLGVRVYVIGLKVEDPADEARLRSIASETGGTYFSAPLVSNMQAIFDEITAEFNESIGQFFTVSDDVTYTVVNVAPSLGVDTTTAVNVTLRVAGEKYHDVTLTLYEDGAAIGGASVIRMPGSPDDQSASLGAVTFDFAHAYAMQVVYTPLDDPVNGQLNGADPAWILLGLANGTVLAIQHAFNVEHPDTWTWDVQDAEGFFLGRGLALAASVADPGSDDVFVTWDWGDGAVDLHVFLSNGVSPDPYPSPEIAPVAVTDLGRHTYAATGTYHVTITVADDDGGTTVLAFDVTVG
ncbi:MAG TPA: VWA domain-containing protein [Thermoplasmata archaeon]|nr:VWA domain-containing protein [Thermoplasmata archaeon]